MTSCRRLIPLVLAMAGSCRNLVENSSPARTPLIEAMLVAGTPSTEVRVRWLEPDGSIPTDATTAEVVLTLVDGSGTRAGLEPFGAAPGHFRARLAISTGHRYSLVGSVGAQRIEASTTVPSRFTVHSPAGDSLRVSPTGTTASGPFGVVPFQWSSDGATVFAVESGYFVPAASYTTAVAGQLLLFGSRLRLLAMNRDLAGYLYASPAETNLTGAFGVLGAAIEIRKEIIWP